jgi:tellurite resistance protein
MPLTPEQEWIVAACGLIAHADGELSEDERDRMLAMLDDRLTDDEHIRWLDLLGDGAALARAFAEMPPPLPVFAEQLLEKAWTMALADGHARDAEVRELERIADGLGIGAAELAGWRHHWTEHAVELAEHTAAFAAVLIHHDGIVDPEEATQFRALLGRLPLTATRREQLARDLLGAAPDLEHVGASLAALPRERRITVLRSLAPLVSVSSRADLGRAFYLDLARTAAIPAELAASLLEP